MQYMGGKSKIGKKIASIMNEYVDGQLDFIEPFVGGFNIVPHIKTAGRVYCGDANESLISLYNALANGWLPPEAISEEEYKNGKYLDDSDPLKSFIGFGCSFGAKWFGGYARNAQGKNYAGVAFRSLMKKLDGIKRVDGFENVSYSELWNYDMPQCVIYCDPPYAGTTGYAGAKGFDHDAFWDWCAKMARRHYVFVSEYACPISHRVVFEKEQTTTLDKSHKKAVEKLFLCEGFE